MSSQDRERKALLASVVYLNIHQVIANREYDVFDGVTKTDFSRPISINVSRNSNHGKDISHVTVEFAGIRAKFFCCLTFDGTGDHGASLANFAMPKLKLNASQKLVVMLSIINYMIEVGHLQADAEFYAEKLAGDLNGGVGNILSKYDAIQNNSLLYIEHLSKRPENRGRLALQSVTLPTTRY